MDGDRVVKLSKGFLRLAIPLGHRQNEESIVMQFRNIINGYIDQGHNQNFSGGCG